MTLSTPMVTRTNKRKFHSSEEKENLPQQLQSKFLDEPFKFTTDFNSQADFFEFNQIAQMEEPALLTAFPSQLEESCQPIIIHQRENDPRAILCSSGDEMQDSDFLEEEEDDDDAIATPNSNTASASITEINSNITQTRHAGKSRGSKRKIKIEFIQERSKRLVTFSKRKNGLIKKAHELNAFTGSEVLLLLTSEKGCVYTYASSKFQPIIGQSEGRKLIQECLGGNELFPFSPAVQNSTEKTDSSSCHSSLQSFNSKNHPELWPVSFQ